MPSFILFLTADILLFSILYFYAKKKGESFPKTDTAIYFILAAGFAVRCAFALTSTGYETDMTCWRAWSERAYTLPLTEFYSNDTFCDYPPLYIYVLYMIAALKNIFNLSGAAYTLLIKLPAIIADTAIGIMLYRLLKPRDKKTGFIIAAFCALHPASFFVSAVWGQCDSVFLVPLILSLYFLHTEKYLKSAFLLALATLTKPQALIFTPFYLLCFAEKFKEDKKLYTKKLLYCVLAFSGGLILILPFIIKSPPLFIFELFIKTLSSYNYASLNAFNLFALFGGNGAPLTGRFLFASYGFWGVAFTVLSVLFCGYVFIRSKKKDKLFFCSALFMTLLYVFGAKMHERYLLPAVILYFITYLISKNRSAFLLSLSFSASLFINIAAVYESAAQGMPYLAPDNRLLMIISAVNVLLAFYAVFTAYNIYLPHKACSAPVPFLSRSKRITRADIYIMAAVTLIYSTVAFGGLGDMVAPTPNHEFADKKNTVAAFSKPQHITSLKMFKGLGDGVIQVIASDDGKNWSVKKEITSADCFAWTEANCDFTAKYVGVDASDPKMEICEMVFYDDKGVRVPLRSTSPLFDEQDLAPDAPSYKNSTYFDEIYHARTAYEHIHYIPHYETTHPPLGKLIIGIGIRLFGMTPFGWRFMGTLFGALMLPLIYLFAKRIFKNTPLSTLAIVLLAADFMHFAQTRIATIDTYGVFFIILMYYFMYIYYDSTAEELPFKKSLWVLLGSGIAFAFGVASKWICLYAALGLAALFFAALCRRYGKLCRECVLTLSFCVAAFIIIPAAVYCLSYIPIYIAEGSDGFLKFVWNYQKHMLTYHSGVDAAHPFASKWYEWPIMARPIWFFGAKEGVLAPGKVSSIVSMGNPLVWWGGSVCALYILYRIAISRGKNDIFLFTGFLSQYLPWCFIGRIVFIYHFFASVPFIILMICAAVQKLSEHIRHKYALLYSVMAAAVLLFILFLPVLYGTPVSRDYITLYLKWFPSWVLCY